VRAPDLGNDPNAFSELFFIATKTIKAGGRGITDIFIQQKKPYFFIILIPICFLLYHSKDMATCSGSSEKSVRRFRVTARGE
jgi:hypothetical protein